MLIGILYILSEASGRLALLKSALARHLRVKLRGELTGYSGRAGLNAAASGALLVVLQLRRI
jgi:hypothetical protein